MKDEKRPSRRAIREAIEGLSSNTARVRFSCLKTLRLISEESPAALYPFIDEFIALLDSENKIMKWGAIIIIGNLAGVDTDNRIDGILDRFLSPITGHTMITAANTICAAGKIAATKPHLADRIAREILKVETVTYQTFECRNVEIGHAIKSFDIMFPHIKRQKWAVVQFVERQLDNSRNAVRTKATLFLKTRGKMTATVVAR